jgi:hypothetical protein
MTDASTIQVRLRKRESAEGHLANSSAALKIGVAAKKHIKHKNKISGLVISKGDNEKN